MIAWTQNLLPLLQLTRMALVFTAIADSMAATLIWARWQQLHEPTRGIWEILSLGRLGAVAVISIGLYGFGMSLNDIIDRRRDRLLAAHRPIPSGRIGVGTAYFICGLLAAATVGGAVWLWFENVASFGPGGWPVSVVAILLTLWTGLLIGFYDLVGKYLVAPGLISLGLVRFFHAEIASPQLPLLWHPLVLMNHVTILSLVAYEWEQKRPTLTRSHKIAVLAGLGIIDLILTGIVLFHRQGAQLHGGGIAGALWITPGLLLPAGAMVVFMAIAYSVYWWHDAPRDAGRAIMLYGLLWLIVYDAAFVAGYVGWIEGGIVLALLPVAWLSVQIMRWSGRVMALSQKPTFKRAAV